MPAPKIWPVGDCAWQVRLPLPWALTSVNVFLFRASRGMILLDTGIRWEDSLASLEAALATLGAGWASISEILVSHLHPDHIGAAREIRRRSAAPVRMPAEEAPLVRPLPRDGAFFADSAAFLAAHGIPAAQVDTLRRQAAKVAHTAERLVVDGHIAAGERIPFDGGTLEAVPAPGHSPAQLCFYCAEQRVLFSTDAILPKVTPNIGVHWFYQDDPLGDYLETLARLERLDAELVVPSHGKPFRGHRPWIARTRRHHERRCETILDAMDGEPLDAYRIAGAIWGEDRSLFERRMAMSEALSHLHFLARERRVESVPVNGVAHWQRS